MTRQEKMDLLYEFSDLCDQARALIGGEPYHHTEIAITTPEEAVDTLHATMPQLEAMVEGCTLCRLSECRTHAVFGEGVLSPLVMVIGEGPGSEEDASGRPFVGRSGKYLDSWLSPIGLFRDKNLYIANVVKCRPPENRTPASDEVSLCVPYLKRQIALVKPRLVLLCGATAVHAMLLRKEGVGALRGETFQVEGIPALVTYHPAGVLRNPDLKKDVWHDIKRIASILKLPILRGK